MSPNDDIDSLLAEAEARPFVGWDFSWLGRRLVTTPPSWNYDSVVTERAYETPDLLDMGTGGGEWLAALPYRPPRTVATEAWDPNVPVANARLRPLGVAVVHVERAPDNASQVVNESRGSLPFRTGSFHLVTNRHAAFVAAEVARVMIPGGRFITQQGGAGTEDFNRLLGLPLPPPSPRPWGLPLAVSQIAASGLEVVASGEGQEVVSFADVGAFVWYLKAIPWAVPDFSVVAFRSRLAMLHDRIQAEGPLEVRQPRFWLEACKRTA
jgi:SAM-dependent methyltransferase